MTTKQIWRLKEQPTTESLRELVKDNILTKEEARAILFSTENQEDRDKKSLEEEIKFLRGLVEKLSQQNRTTIVETIREIEKPWKRYPWYEPYHYWCDASSSTFKLNGDFTAGNSVTSGKNGLNMKVQKNHLNTSFKDISTF